MRVLELLRDPARFPGIRMKHSAIMRELRGYKGRKFHPYFSPRKSIEKDRRVVDGNLSFI